MVKLSKTAILATFLIPSVAMAQVDIGDQIGSSETAIRASLETKGYVITEMAELRDTKQGTVKAQCAFVYKKADVSGRLQLLSVFLDDLMADSLVPSTEPATIAFPAEL